MKLPFKFKSNPQAFKVSLIITLTVFILNFITHQLFSTNTDLENKSLFTSILYFLILFIIVRITVKFYIRKQINIGVSKILGELNPEILRDFTEDKNLEIITDEIIKDSFIFDYYKDNKRRIIKLGYRFIFQSHIKTLSDSEINKKVNEILSPILKIDRVSIPGM